MKEARFYEGLEKGQVICRLCPHHCRISPGQAGLCRVRENHDGMLVASSYGIVSSWGMDPIEKKPLYHFFPGSRIFSVGGVGCNFRCQFCQNWQIAQTARISAVRITPEEVAAEALLHPENLGIAYTYNEPTVGFEFVSDCAKLVREKGLKNVLVTNGFIEKEPLDELLPYIDAMNIDIKGNEQFYKDMISGRLSPVKDTVERAYSKCHVEITNLVIGGVNDTDREIDDLAKWISGLSKDIPLHITRYFPSYKLNLPATPIMTVERARQTALKHLNFVYTGNGGDPRSSDTYCPNCGYTVISRRGYRTQNYLADNRCPRCGQSMDI